MTIPTVITLDPIGDIPLKTPSSFSAMIGLNQASTEDGMIGFVLAAALGMCWGHSRSVPRYVSGTSVTKYGAKVLDHLIGLCGVKAGPQLWSAGQEALRIAQAAIPIEEVVRASADFSTPQTASST